jgi:type VI secretion system secreted protein VgrG
VRGYDFTRAGRPPAGTVIGTTSGGVGGAFGDAVSGGLAALGAAAGPAAGAVTGLGGAAGEHTNVSTSHGVTTATHAWMPREVALGRTAIAAGAAGLGQAFGDAGVADALGALGGAAQGLVGGSEEALEIYEHHGDHEEMEATYARAVCRLEQHRAEVVLARGRTYCRRMTPGHVFTLREHPVAELDRGWVVTEVVHELSTAPGDGMPIYQNAFVCVPDDTAYRPPRPARKVHHVVETAVVVGPAESEIATEPYGRVKIQFRWDRLRKHDDHSSCWVRVAQPWSGPGYGFQFVPRIGAEVLVSFLGGDVDRPVVVGCLPNLANPLPYALPRNETQSGIRTSSTPRSDGYSEIMLDDAAGAELVHIRAERDLTEDVLHDRATTIGNDDRVDVKGSQRTSVEKDHALVVGGDGTTTVAGRRHDRTEGERITEVCGHDITEVAAGQSTQIAGARFDTVRGSATFSVGGAHSVSVQGDAMLSVGSADQPSHRTVAVGGDHTTVAETVVVSGRERVVIVCGGSVIVVEDGKVQVRTDEVKLLAKDSIEVATDAGAGLRITDGVEIFGASVVALSQGSVLRLTDQAALGGGEVHLGSGDSASSSRPAEEERETQSFAVQLTAASGSPHAGRRFRLVAGSDEIAGTTDGDGWVRERIAVGVTQALVTVWTGDYPGGPRSTWSIAIGELADSSSPAGARARLTNLGYAPGAADAQDADGGLDPTTRSALRRFQRDHGVEETGELDDATSGALRDAHHT